MKFTKKQFSLWRIVLFVGVMAIAIPITASLSPTLNVIAERQEYVVEQTDVNNDDAGIKNTEDNNVAVGKIVRQDGYYADRRRRYLENRIERRLDAEEGGDDDDEADDDRSNSRAASNDEDDEEDDEEDVVSSRGSDRVERRREYFRRRVERGNW